MNQSFTATIHFALLALAMVFTANLVAAVNYAGTSCIFGVAMAMLAAGAAYAGQHFFTQADWWLAHHKATTAPGYAGPAHPDAWENYESNHKHGISLQLVSAGTAGLSGFLFVIGAL